MRTPRVFPQVNLLFHLGKGARSSGWCVLHTRKWRHPCTLILILEFSFKFISIEKNWNGYRFANSPFYPSVRPSSPTYFTSTFISNSADGLVYPSTLSGEVLCDTLRLVWCVCVRPFLCQSPMVSRYNLRTDFKFCTVVWYHKIQIKFEFQCDQIIGSKSCDSLKAENMWNVAGYKDPRQTVINMLHWGWTFN
jgi:hypothetical protein